MIHKTWHIYIYVIHHFGSTGKSTPRSMKKKLIFCEFVMVTIRFEFYNKMSSNSDSGFN